MFVLGLFFLILISSVFIYYFSSGLNLASNPKSVFLKINETFLDRYLGVNILKLNDYTNLVKIKTKYLFSKPKIQQLNLKVGQKTILLIEQQRQLKKENGGILPPEYFKMHRMELQHEKKKFKAKIRIKGVRPIHWQDKRTTS